MKVLVFDIWADYGHFKKFYTTSSPLTFSFPPPSTIQGIMGAIYGAGKSDYLELFSLKKCKIALQIIKPIKKVRLGINLINTKGGIWRPLQKKYHEPRTQIRTELVKEPHYRIYLKHDDYELFNNIIKMIKKHESIYTVSFGLSELIANFKFIGKFEANEIIPEKPVEISTTILASNVVNDGIRIETGKKYYKEKIPIVMNNERIIEKYDDVIFEIEGKTIKSHLMSYYHLEDGVNIAFF